MQSIFDRQYQVTQRFAVPEIAPLPRIRSARSARVAQLFGLADRLNLPEVIPQDDARTRKELLRSLVPGAGQITLFTGPSGAGKSSMLRALRRIRSSRRFVDLNRIDLPDRPLVDCFGQTPLDETLALLSRVGLAEAWSYLRSPRQLSEGQRWRLKLAIGMRQSTGVPASAGMDSRDQKQTCGLKPARRPTILLADEFAALLDRITAAIVAHCLRRAINTALNLAAILATSHEDLIRALAPDTIVYCDFQLIEVRRRITATNPRRTDPIPRKRHASPRRPARANAPTAGAATR